MIGTAAGAAGPFVDEVPRDSARLFARIAGATLPLLVALVLLIGYAASLRTPIPLWADAALVGVVVGLSAAHAATRLGQYARSVRVDPRGIELQYGRYSIEAPWADWTPVGHSWITGGVSFRTRTSGPDYFVVTAEQAEAILKHPNCPSWELDESMAELAGVPEPPAPPG